ncbi:heat stress transcription factor A-8 [Mangifera indica]|uniref:heat stress transcription factor A-8 n=1 Tax=Mangifera indica TaxID=29780 RepID=UPI001CFBABC7|nr:heat stress transcription factor A-8 [Mangifera indica]
MVKSSENGSVSVAPFLKKCYDMVDDESTDLIISWSQNGESFVIWDMTEFSVKLLPKYFKHNNFSSFIRQLNIYGFRKVDTDRWEFANDGFIRGQKHLLNNISRRKNSQAPEQRKLSQQSENVFELCDKIDNLALWREVENLKTDKNSLAQELVKLRQYQETADNKLLVLRERIQGVETNQQQMLSFLVMAMQNPNVLVQLLQPKENNWRIAEAGSILEEVSECGEPVASDNMLVRYQAPVDETLKPVLAPVTDSEFQPESDTSGGKKDFFMNIDFMKILMEETHVPFIPPDINYDGEWEKLLLGSPFIENTEDNQQDREARTGSEMEVEPTVSGIDLEKLQNFELLLQQMDKSQNSEIEPTSNGSHLERPQNLEFCTETMEHLASESNYKF